MTIPVIDVNNYDTKYLLQCLVSHGYLVLRNWQSLSNNNSQITTSDSSYLQINNAKPQFGTITVNRLNYGDPKQIQKSSEGILNSVSDSMVSLISKSFGLNYGFFDQCLSDQSYVISSNNPITNCNLVSLIHTTGANLKLYTRYEKEPIELGSQDEPTLILSVGKIFEIITKGMVFNNILKVEGSNYTVFSKSLNLDLKISDVIKLSSSFMDNKPDINKFFLQRVWKINYLKDPTIGAFEDKKFFNNANTNVNTGKEHMFGYLRNQNLFLQIDPLMELNYVGFDTTADPYLINFKMSKKIGDVFIDEIVYHQKDTNNELFNQIFTQSFKDFANFHDNTLKEKLKALVRIFSNLDNVIYIYFLDHTNLPSLSQFLPNMTKLLGKEVTVSDILKIKYLYPQSYELFKVVSNNDKTNLLIGLPKEQLQVTNFAKEIVKRKEIFSQLVDTFVSREDLHSIDEKINQVYNDLPLAPSDFKPAASSINRKLSILKESAPKITKLSKISKQKAQPINDKKLSLIERIRLKEAQKKKLFEIDAPQGNGTNTGELLMIFEILYNLNTTNGVKSFPIKSIVGKIIDSLKATKFNLMSGEHLMKILRAFDEKLPDEILQIVNFANNGNIILKYDFYNKRNEIIEFLSK
ncbi:hypothetical protein DASC09_052440 [Saccharomycopsis crataegensis]|uniref:DNA replication factor Cdt1 C-terminal domain-containing protein n=1 Tax=Saccharomycopsis crataegensis TaxID=43959 RepID=A0AAV5QTT8_9ASCO|nr:hypothetical protein DASC09_052440 [Saccharomycopsis crataegensis]